MESVIIGIDPGKFTGIAIFKNKVLELFEMDFWRTVDFLTDQKTLSIIEKQN